MKITKIETFPVTVPTGSFVSALTKFGAVSKMSAVLVKLHTHEGLTGIGECPPEPLFFGETVESCESAILRYLAPVVVGMDARQVELILERLDWALVGNPCAKQSIELALFDLLGKEINVPVYDLLGGKYREEIEVGWELSSGEIRDVVHEALDYTSRGVTTLKLKVGVLDLDTEIETVQAVRKAVGEEVNLRIDANQGWTPNETIRAVHRLSDVQLELMEQPVHRSDLDGLAMIRSAVDTPVEADESVFSPADAINLIRKNAADLINIKIPKAGGLLRSKQIAAIAHAAGMKCRVGSNLDMGVDVSAKLHLAASTPNMDYASEFTELAVLKDDILNREFELSHGHLRVPNGPGLGVELSEEKVRKYGSEGFIGKQHTYP